MRIIAVNLILASVMALSGSVLVSGDGDFKNPCLEAMEQAQIRNFQENKQYTFEQQVIAPYVEVGKSKADLVGAGTVIKVNDQIYVLTAGHVAECFAKKHENTLTSDSNDDREETGDNKSPYSPGYKDRAGKTYLTEEESAWNRVVLSKEDESGRNHTSWTGEIVWYRFDEKVDLALVKVFNPEGLKPAEWEQKIDLRRGQDCWYIGTPGGLHASLEKSIISRPFIVFEDRDGASRTVFNGNGWYGNSGGGLYVSGPYKQYILVGVVVELYRGQEKSPIMSVTQNDIFAFVKAFTDHEASKSGAAR